MQAKTVLSSRGQLVIPKFFRSKMGLHLGSEMVIELKNNDTLELKAKRKNITSFFGLGKKTKNKTMSLEDMDGAIKQAVLENDKR